MRKDEEVKQILSQIRFSSTSAAIDISLPQAGADQATSLLETGAEMEVLLRRIYTTSITLPMDPVPSPRPGIGKFITFVKKLFLKAIRPLVSMFLQPQIDFNEDLADQLKLTDRFVRHLARDVQKLYAEQDSFRLKHADLERENARLKKEIETLSK